MKTLMITALAFISFYAAAATNCGHVYVNTIGSPSAKESQVIEKLQSYLAQNYPETVMSVSSEYLYPHLENERNFKANSTIISIADETDFTGREVQVDIYSSNENGEVEFVESVMRTARFRKAVKLYELSIEAINYSCKE